MFQKTSPGSWRCPLNRACSSCCPTCIFTSSPMWWPDTAERGVLEALLHFCRGFCQCLHYVFSFDGGKLSFYLSKNVFLLFSLSTHCWVHASRLTPISVTLCGHHFPPSVVTVQKSPVFGRWSVLFLVAFKVRLSGVLPLSPRCLGVGFFFIYAVCYTLCLLYLYFHVLC